MEHYSTIKRNCLCSILTSQAGSTNRVGASDAELNWKHQFCFWLHPFIACELKVLSENSNA